MMTALTTAPATTVTTTAADTTANEAAFRRLIDEGFTRGSLDVVDELIATDTVEHQHGMGQGPDGAKGAIAFLHRLAPDFTLTVDDLVAQGDTVWGRCTARGTHTGPGIGAPTGRTWEITVIDVCRFRDGKIVEHWGVPDRFAQLEQLGLLPPA